jgi:putative modified peptide
MAREPFTIDLSRRDASTFLKRVATDDNYRRRLKRNPEKALAEHGISVPEGFIAPDVTLPSKAEFEGLADYIAGRPDPRPPSGPADVRCLWFGLALMARAARQAGRPKT